MAPDYQCVHCGSPIDLEDTNVATDVALCRSCGQTMAFSTIVGRREFAGVDLSKPPKGVRVETSIIRGVELRYHRFSPLVLFFIPFTAIWSGFSLWGIYGRQFAEGKFDPGAALAGLPFLIGTIFLLAFIAFLLFGTRRLSITPGRAEVFTGVGPIGWRKSMPLSRTTHINLALSNYRVNRVPQPEIVVTNEDGEVKFGATLPEDVRSFFAATLRKATEGS